MTVTDGDIRLAALIDNLIRAPRSTKSAREHGRAWVAEKVAAYRETAVAAERERTRKLVEAVEKGIIALTTSQFPTEANILYLLTTALAEYKEVTDER